jgi:Cu/Zn superoxide dismutase
MERKRIMFSAQARWLLLVGLSSAAFLACGGEEPGPAGTAGSSSGGSSAGSQVGGSPSGGAGGGAGGTGGGVGGAGGAGGSTGGGGSGGAAGPTATAQIMGVNGQNVMGSVTFTQGPTMTKMVMTLTACPDGARSSHLHLNNDCGDNAMAAGNHWVPNGEMLGDYSCANNMATLEKEKPISMWNVGDDADTDVTKHAFMVHAMSDGDGSGARWGCGTFPP